MRKITSVKIGLHLYFNTLKLSYPKVYSNQRFMKSEKALMPLLGHSEETHFIPSSEALLFLSPFKHIRCNKEPHFFRGKINNFSRRLQTQG